MSSRQRASSVNRSWALQHQPFNGLTQSYQAETLTSVRAPVYVHFTLTLVLNTNKSHLHSHLIRPHPPGHHPRLSPRLIREQQPIIGCGAWEAEESMVGRRLQESITRADSTLERKEQQTCCCDGCEWDKSNHTSVLTLELHANFPVWGLQSQLGGTSLLWWGLDMRLNSVYMHEN